MKTQFTPIAMRFKKENWESIKDKIEAAGIGHNVWAIGNKYYYLANNWQDDHKLFIGNHCADHSNLKLVSKVYETWDEAIFLRACGIEPEVYTVPKEFILEGHKAACSTWKAKIEAQFPELFPKLEVGRWLKDDSNPEWLMYRDGKNIYGFDTNGDWFYKENESYEPMSRDRYATDEEVQTALIAEAKRRGFKDGVEVARSGVNGDLKHLTLKLIGFKYHKQSNSLDSVNKDGYYFRNGKWAEIIPETVELSLEDIAEKFGVNVSQIKIKS